MCVTFDYHRVRWLQCNAIHSLIALAVAMQSSKAIMYTRIQVHSHEIERMSLARSQSSSSTKSSFTISLGDGLLLLLLLLPFVGRDFLRNPTRTSGRMSEHRQQHPLERVRRTRNRWPIIRIGFVRRVICWLWPSLLLLLLLLMLARRWWSIAPTGCRRSSRLVILVNVVVVD